MAAGVASSSPHRARNEIAGFRKAKKRNGDKTVSVAGFMPEQRRQPVAALSPARRAFFEGIAQTEGQNRLKKNGKKERFYQQSRAKSRGKRRSGMGQRSNCFHPVVASPIAAAAALLNNRGWPLMCWALIGVLKTSRDWKKHCGKPSCPNDYRSQCSPVATRIE
jgi:hypothetical protein